MEVRALEVAFRHLAEPARQVFGPTPISLDGVVWRTDGHLSLDASEGPSWSVDGPRGFRFAYVPPFEEQAAMFAARLTNVPVTLVRFWRTATGWVPHARRFEGVLGSAVWEGSVLRCEAVARSQTLSVSPVAPVWSLEAQQRAHPADTGMRWMRAASRQLRIIQ